MNRVSSFFDAIQKAFPRKGEGPKLGEDITEADAFGEEGTSSDTYLPVDEDAASYEDAAPSPRKASKLSGLLACFGGRKKHRKPQPAHAPKKDADGGKSGQKIHKTRFAVFVTVASLGLAGGYFYMNWADEQEAINRPVDTAPKASASVLDDDDAFPDSFNVNPFVEASAAPVIGADGQMTLPPAGSSTVRAMPGGGGGYHYNGVLPAIPYSMPRPNLPTFQMPAHAPASSGSTPAASAPASAGPLVSGVMTGGNGNIAIMGDGSVVSEGETYNNKRIAFIGGDGIQFDDGSSIQYKP